MKLSKKKLGKPSCKIESSNISRWFGTRISELVQIKSLNQWLK